MRFFLPIAFFLYAVTVSAQSPLTMNRVQKDSSGIEHEMKIDLRNPTYKNGILYTSQGGVIYNKNIRIQAKTIQYIRKGSIHTIEAEGDLLIQYKGRVYTGNELQYDFTTNSGIIYEGKTFASYWYVGGDILYLNADGSYKVENAFITTCENQDSSWDLHAKTVDVIKGDMLAVKNARFRIFKIPTLWLPSFKLNLKKFKEPILKYDIRWDSGLGPRISTRYQLYSWQDFAIYGRVEYRWATGFGGALETEYLPSDFNTRFVTRSYLAKDRLVTATEKMQRYRVQGNFHSKSKNERTSATICWDKYSDVRMPNDFKSDDFEINPAKNTIFHLCHRNDYLSSSFKLRPRANPFESIKQDLPTLYATVRPIQIGSTGISSISYLKASYLDFVYSNQLVSSLSSYHSPRIEFKEKLYRSFGLGAMTFTPYLEGIGIFYGNSPSSFPKLLGLLSYGARAETRATRQYEHYKHQINPYAEFTGLSNPTISPDQHYIFSIQDGYDRIDQLRIGIRNLLFFKNQSRTEPSFTADLYANGFFVDQSIPQLVPYGYLDLDWRLSHLNLTWENSWNFRQKTLQYSNARLLWTINENIAFSLEGRYRSRYDWRKADHENFILDVSRSQTELLLSPLSDRRITFLTNLFIRLTPFWECRIQSHHGFFRENEPPYNEVKVDLFTWISPSLKLRLSFAHSADRGINSVGAQINLVR